MGHWCWNNIVVEYYLVVEIIFCKDTKNNQDEKDCVPNIREDINFREIESNSLFNILQQKLWQFLILNCLNWCLLPLAKAVVYLGSISGILRELLSIVIFFAPCLGLFNLLHHIKFDKIPFKARLEYAKTNAILKSDEIKLHNLNETLYWSDLDRFNYSEDPFNPIAPSHTFYTFFRHSFK